MSVLPYKDILYIYWFLQFDETITASQWDFHFPSICHFLNSAFSNINYNGNDDDLRQVFRTRAAWSGNSLIGALRACAKADLIYLFDFIKTLLVDEQISLMRSEVEQLDGNCKLKFWHYFFVLNT